MSTDQYKNLKHVPLLGYRIVRYFRRFAEPLEISVSGNLLPWTWLREI